MALVAISLCGLAYYATPLGVSHRAPPARHAWAQMVAPQTPTPEAAAGSETAASPSRVLVSHILTLSEEMAQLLQTQLAEGADFAELAEGASACDSKAHGGLLGWIAPGLMVPQFDLVAFTAEPGEVRVVASEFGWHVIKVWEQSFTEAIMAPVELRDRLLAGDSEGDDASLVLLDVRDDEEMKQAKIPDGTFLHHPYNDWQRWGPLAIAGELEGVDAKKELVLIDHRGGRGERLMQYLAQNGLPHTRYVRGGINAYAEEADPSVPTYLESDGDCLTCHEH